MEDVTWNRTGDQDRGQLVLIAGIVVAFALVALVLLLNSALFAENIATRAVDPGVERAGDHRGLAERLGRGVLRSHESVEYELWSDARANVSHDIVVTNSLVTDRRFERHGAETSIGIETITRGAVLVQNDSSRNFTDISGAENERWTLANTTGIRNFSMTVERSGTENVQADRRFTVVVSGANGSSWTAYVNATDSEIRLWLPEGPCDVPADNATIHWTAGTFGDDCSFDFASGLDSPYELSFRNGENATGTFHVVVSNTSNDDVATENLAGPGTGGNPRYYPAAYGVVLRVSYQESTVSYDTVVRTAPSEPDETARR